MLYTLLGVFLLSFLSTCIAQSLAGLGATAGSLVYGFPLLAFEKLASNGTAQRVNSYQHAQNLATAADTAVVAPNSDTLYSSMTYDLSQGDVIITVPDIPADQFHLLAFYDTFGDNFALTGTYNLNQPGQYRLRPTPEGSEPGVDTSNKGSYQAYINSPTIYGSHLIRWLINATNLDAVHTYQNAMGAENATRSGSSQPSNIPPLLDLIAKINEAAAQSSTPPTPAQEVLGLLTAYSPYNPPENASEVPVITKILAAAGISNGTYTPPAGLDLNAANNTATTAVSASLAAPGAAQNLTNGWAMLSPSLTGDFGIRYGIRALVAKMGYLQLKAPNAIYPSWSNASSGSGASASTPLHLPSNSAILYTFVGGLPPLKQIGFWSLTAYDSQNYLIPNPIGVYARGDRSNLTYSDGTLLYPGGSNVNSPPSSSASSKSFQILVQPADVPPPANWTTNWLPGPAGGGDMNLILRFYMAEDQILQGDYVMPEVALVEAITNGSSSSGSGSGSGSSGGSGSTSGATATAARRISDVVLVLTMVVAAMGLWW